MKYLLRSFAFLRKIYLLLLLLLLFARLSSRRLVFINILRISKSAEKKRKRERRGEGEFFGFLNRTFHVDIENCDERDGNTVVFVRVVGRGPAVRISSSNSIRRATLSRQSKRLYKVYNVLPLVWETTSFSDELYRTKGKSLFQRSMIRKNRIKYERVELSIGSAPLLSHSLSLFFSRSLARSRSFDDSNEKKINFFARTIKKNYSTIALLDILKCCKVKRAILMRATILVSLLSLVIY